LQGGRCERGEQANAPRLAKRRRSAPYSLNADWTEHSAEVVRPVLGAAACEERVENWFLMVALNVADRDSHERLSGSKKPFNPQAVWAERRRQ
jgi:hypothetical protein